MLSDRAAGQTADARPVPVRPEAGTPWGRMQEAVNAGNCRSVMHGVRAAVRRPWPVGPALVGMLALASSVMADSLPLPDVERFWRDRARTLAGEVQVSLRHPADGDALAAHAREQARLDELHRERLAAAYAALRADEAHREAVEAAALFEHRTSASLARIAHGSRRKPPPANEFLHVRLLAAEALQLRRELQDAVARTAAARAGRHQRLRQWLPQLERQTVRLAAAAAGLETARALRLGHLLDLQDGLRRQAAVERRLAALTAVLDAAGRHALPGAGRPVLAGRGARLHAHGVPPATKGSLASAAMARLAETVRMGRHHAFRQEHDRMRLPPIMGVVQDGSHTVAAGLHAHGIMMQAQVPQTVSAPVDGTIAFAGTFRNFGLLLIIDQGSGYHTLLAGLTQLDVEQGDGVVAGQAVGEIAVRGDKPAHLYMELRYQGVPVDLSPSLAAREDKVRG